MSKKRVGRKPSTGVRRLNHDHRLQGYSLEEIVAAWEQVTSRLALDRRFQGRKLKPGPALNAVIIAYMGLTHEQKLAMLDAGLTELERLLDLPEPQGFPVVPPHFKMPVAAEADIHVAPPPKRPK